MCVGGLYVCVCENMCMWYEYMCLIVYVSMCYVWLYMYAYVYVSLHVCVCVFIRVLSGGKNLNQVSILASYLKTGELLSSIALVLSDPWERSESKVWLVVYFQ